MKTFVYGCKHLQTDVPDSDSDSDSDNNGEFEVFWKAYPKKVGKRNALLKWEQLKPNLQQCIQAIEQSKRSEQWRKDKGQFIPYPATWLHQGRWDDAPKVEIKTHTPIKEKKDPDGWAEWRDTTYPTAEKISYWNATNEIQEEFNASMKYDDWIKTEEAA